MSEFVDNLHTVFELFGSISVRRMFGGHGVYHNQLMIALVADDELYMKGDAQSVHYFTDLGLPAFEYTKKGKRMKMSYFLAPADIYDDPEVAKLWAGRAYEAANRARKKTKKKRKPKP